MAILTDLPNELLLSIIADMSPLYIDSFVLSCKRIYGLRKDTIRAQNLVRSTLPSQWSRLQPIALLRCILQDPDLALYPLSWVFSTRNCGDHCAPEDLVAEINALVQQSPHTAHLKTNHGIDDAGDLVFPLLITRLLNLRRVRVYVSVSWSRHLLDAVSHIVETSHDPGLNSEETLPLGRLREARIDTDNQSYHAMELAVLLAMIPTLRKLQVSGLEAPEPFDRPYKYHLSEVTDMYLDGCVYPNTLTKLIMRAHGLQKFVFTHRTMCRYHRFDFRQLAETLIQRAGYSLSYLSLLTLNSASCIHGLCLARPRNYSDLSVGSLRGFSNLKILETCVDMFIKTHDLKRHGVGSGTVQKLIEWLPASLETLVLHQGLKDWAKGVLRMLFRGLRHTKHTQLPNLRLIIFVKFPNFDDKLTGIKTACRESGVKLAYTKRSCPNPECRQATRLLSMWEELAWISALGDCCRRLNEFPYDWVSLV